MTLRAQAQALLDDVVNAEKRIDRPELIKRLRTLTNAIPEILPHAYEDSIFDLNDATTMTEDPSRFKPRENTPQRKMVHNWNKSKCKRCLGPDTDERMMIVHIPGVGWWHDDCYRIVNSTFYEGLD